MALHRLKDFDPESFSANGAAEVVAAPAMLELEAAGVVRVSEAGPRSTAPPTGSASSGSPSILAWASSSARTRSSAHNAAEWQHGLLVQVPKGVVLEQPLLCGSRTRSRAACLLALLIVAEPAAASP